MPLQLSILRNLICLLFIVLPACNEINQISDSGFGAFEADIEVLDADTVAIAWYDTRHSKAEIYLRLLDHRLKPISAEFRLSENNVESYEVDIVALGENIAASWYEIDASEHSVVKLGLWNRQGEQLWLKTLTAAGVNARIPVLEVTARGLFVAWLETDAATDGRATAATIVGEWIDPAGLSHSGPFKIAAASINTWNLNVDIDSSGDSTTVFLAFDAQYETVASELYLARISDRGIEVNRLTDDDGYNSKYPDIALRDGRLALTWFDNLFGNNEIYLTVRSIADLSSPQVIANLELGATRISRSEGDSIAAYLAWNENSLGLAWSDSAGDQHDVYFQQLDVTGKPQSDIRQLSHTEADSLIPSINSFASGFVLTWNEVTVNAHDAQTNLSRSEIVVTLIE